MQDHGEVAYSRELTQPGMVQRDALCFRSNHVGVNLKCWLVPYIVHNKNESSRSGMHLVNEVICQADPCWVFYDGPHAEDPWKQSPPFTLHGLPEVTSLLLCLFSSFFVHKI